MESLQTMDQHRAVGLLEDVAAHLDLVVRPDCHQVRVEGRMMQRTEGDAVRHSRRAKRFTVANDVSGLQELIVPQTTDGAVTLVSFEYPLSELLLVQPLLH